ncbi:MAG: proteasome assembly chaperone family protein [Candidatus Diapherotrites archaeon]|nr:proteasome assembly chaperone family protein [Candidatus Diapherotrites archaeon]
MREHAEVKINEFNNLNLTGYTLIEGFPGLGLVGTICAKHLIEKLKMQKLGCINSDIFVPVIRIRDGKPVHPSRIFVSKTKKLVVVISEQIIPKEFTDDFARAMVEWIKKKKFIKVVSLNGLTVPEKSKEIYGYASDDSAKNYLKKNKVKLIEEGITTGISALMMLELKNVKTQGMSLLTPVTLSADYEAAANLMTKLNEMYKFNLDVKPLLEEAKKVEAELSNYMEKLKAMQQTTQGKENQVIETPTFT